MPASQSLSVVRLRAARSCQRLFIVGLGAFVLLAGLSAARPAAAQSVRRPPPDLRNATKPIQRARYSSPPRQRYDMAQAPRGGPEYVETPYADGQGGPYEFETGGQYYDDAGGYFPADPYGDSFMDGGSYGGCDGCGSCDSCGGCGGWFQNCGLHNFYARVDYLLWWGKGFNAPPLVTTSPLDTPREEAGVLGFPDTSVLFPNGNLATDALSGGRIRLGYWFDPCDTAAIEGTYFAVGKATSNFSASDADYPILARPFVNVEEDFVGNDAELVAYPELFSGSISASATSKLQGADLIFRHVICRTCDWRIDWLAGWRYNRLDESLVVSDGKEVLSSQTGLVVGTTLSEWDRFSTKNTFNGVEIGIITERRWCRWWLETRGTLALGNNRAVVNIDGQATTTVPIPGGTTQTTVTEAGLLAQGTNIGQYVNDDFAIVPQLGINVGWEITCGLWATFGYNFMYWSRVARPGDQIDTDVNLSQLAPGGLVGLPRPAYTDITTDYWAQGLNFGLAYRY